MPVAFEGGKGKKRELPEKREKTFGKKFEKRLDKAGGMWYSIWAVRKRGQRVVLEN